jgi:Zn-dependent peptidase ImmA (M78 family)/transcriptional regulator with XRE-family HTH domain
MIGSIPKDRGTLSKPIPERIREAREASGFQPEIFAEMLGVSRQALARFENGLLTPSGETMRNIIGITKLPPSFFVSSKDRSANGITPFWRGLKRMEAHHRKRIARRMEWLHDIVAYVNNFVDLPELSLPHLDFDPTSSDVEQIEIAADALRDHWKLGRGPVLDVSAIMENHGILLARESVGCEDMDAVSCWQFGRPYVLYSADVVSGPRNEYNLCHELAHVLLHSAVEVTSENLALIEKQANRFASAFLMPQETFSRDVLGTSLNHFLFLKEKWGISIAAMAYRCKDLGILNSDQLGYLMRQLNARGIRKREPLDDKFLVRQPNVINESIRLLLDNGIKSKSEIADALALNPSDIEQLCGLPKGHLESTIVQFKPRLLDTENNA